MTHLDQTKPADEPHQDALMALMVRYPKLFHRRPPVALNQVPKGWVTLVGQLCAQIDQLYQEHPVDLYLDEIRAVDGVLGVSYSVQAIEPYPREWTPEYRSQRARYTQDADAFKKQVRGLIDEAEAASRSLCLECGAPGQSRLLVGVSDLCPKGYFTDGVDLPESGPFADNWAPLCDQHAGEVAARYNPSALSSKDLTQRLLYLDFDGVLHSGVAAFLMTRQFSNPDLASEGLFVKVPELDAALKPFPDVRIIVSSSWRNLYPIERLVEVLGPLGERVIGMTGRPIGTRYQDIAAHVHRAKPRDWVAIDDDDRGWSPKRRGNLIHCDYRTGLTPEDLLKLQERLAKGAGTSGKEES